MVKQEPRKLFIELSLTEIAEQTVETFREFLIELPSAKSPEAAGHLLLQGDRKIYFGILLGLFAIIVLMFFL